MSKLPRNIVVVDLETTGLDPEKCGILEIGAVRFDGDRFYSRVALERGRSIEPAALDCNGIDAVDLTLGVSLGNALSCFVSWLGSDRQWVMVGKNPQFDYGFLKAHWPVDCSVKLSDLISRRTVDLHSLAYAGAIKLGADISADGFSGNGLYLDLLGIEPEPVPHNALRGALYEMECLKGLLWGCDAMMPPNDFKRVMADVDRVYLQRL